MKKLAVLIVCAAVMASCDSFSGGKKDQLKAENDSLLMELTQRNAELDEMMGTFNDISEGFRQINAAESRVDLQRGAVAEGSLSAKQQITSDIEFIRKQMEENKEQIAKLQAQLKNSKNSSVQLKKAVEALTQELVAKTQRIEELQAELASRNIRIQELDAAVSGLSADKEMLSAENEAKAKTVAEQDKELNTAWFVFGTKKELKDQKILSGSGLFKKGEVLKDGDVNKDYFTQVDLRTTKEIKLYSKDADILTTHPAGSYALEKDDKGQLTLKITNPKEFWSVSRYLVIQVK
jgi:DNA repair exonuclease SbcCD ATPase subunit